MEKGENMRETKNATVACTTLLTIPEVAERLAVGERKVWRLISQKLLPAVKVGARGTRVTVAVLESYIAGLSAPAGGECQP
jgi:excisionase family DNA binding protein